MESREFGLETERSPSAKQIEEEGIDQPTIPKTCTTDQCLQDTDQGDYPLEYLNLTLANTKETENLNLTFEETNSQTGILELDISSGF